MVILYGTKNFKSQKDILLFPVWRKKMLICPFCEYGIKVDDKNKCDICGSVLQEKR